MWWILWVSVACLLRSSSAGNGLTKEVIILYWNTTNPIFRIDNNDNIIDVGSSPMVYDQVNIVCPVYTPGSISEENTEQFVIYHVNKEEYDTCRIMKPYPHILADCNTPFKPRYFTISFRSFSPTPGALEFHPGKDYYFISTSSKGDLHRRLGGSCLTNNMKVVFKVKDKTATTTTTTTTTATIPRTTQKIDSSQRNMFSSIRDEEDHPYYVRDPYFSDDEELRKKERRKKPWKNHSVNSILNDQTSRETSLVEKVNNLMKQEVIRSNNGSSSLTLFKGAAGFIIIIIMALLLPFSGLR